RAAINAPIQGSAADIIRRAMIRMVPALEAAGLSARMLMQVHDELVFEAPEGEVEKTMEVARHVMEKSPEPALKLKVPLKVDARAGDNWEAAHYVSSPRGPSWPGLSRPSTNFPSRRRRGCPAQGRAI